MRAKFSHHFSHDWISQYWRMQRWALRAKKALLRNILSEEDLDDIYAFFISAFSLRDWIKKSTEIQINDLDDQLNSFKYWGLCRDIANGLKHLELNNPSLDPNFTIWCSGKENMSQNEKEYWFVLANNKIWSLQQTVDSISKFWVDLLKPYEEANPIRPILNRNQRS